MYLRILFLLLCISAHGVAQKIKLIDGQLKMLHNEVAVNFEFMYDTLHGSTNHDNSFEKRFLMGFRKQTNFKINENAPYTVILHSLPAETLKDDTVYIVETQHKMKRIATLAIPKLLDKIGKDLGRFFKEEIR